MPAFRGQDDQSEVMGSSPIKRGATDHPSGRSRKLRRVQEESDEESDAEQDISQASPSRPLTNGVDTQELDDGLEESEDEQEGVEVEDGQIVQARRHTAPMQVLKADTDGYVPGSIVRIELSEFLTYSAVTFSPGPRLNLVIGPNGTGKSSIVCGIALGLGFPPKILGRAPDISSFVRQGKQNAFIKITLKGKIGSPNVTIKRSFQRNNKTSQWEIDGEN